MTPSEINIELGITLPRPLAGRKNDPNGLTQWCVHYRLFQRNPYEARWGFYPLRACCQQ
jgi:hypothetical protein